MTDSKYFGIPFGSSGDRATIPEASQPSGSVSWTQGFGPDYERDPDTDPAAKRVPRDETNEYLYQMSLAIKFLQLYGQPEWYAADGLGTPVTYPLSARVRFDAGAGMQSWVSIVATNTATPGSDATKWALDEAFSMTALEATQAEANAGLIGGKIITPRRMSTAVQRGQWNIATGTGTGTAYAATLTPVPTSYVNGLRALVTIPATNTVTNPTLNLNGLGAVPIISGAATALNIGDIQAVALCEFVYLAGSFLLVNYFPASETNRGVVELGSAAELAAGADLTRVSSIGRLATQIQNGSWVYVAAGGTANALTAALTPAPAALVAGMRVNLLLSNANTGAVTLNVNGLGAVAVLAADGVALTGGELGAGLFSFIYNGAVWMIVNRRTASTTASGNARFATITEMNAGVAPLVIPALDLLVQLIQQNSWNWCGFAGGSANALTANTTPNNTNVPTGRIITLIAGTPNTGPATLNFNGTGALPIQDGNGAALQANDLHGFVFLVRTLSGWAITSLNAASETMRGSSRFATASELAVATDFSLATSAARIAAQIQSGGWTVAAAGGTATALTLTLSPAPPALTQGMVFVLLTTSAATGPATLNLNGLGAKAVTDLNGAPITPGFWQNNNYLVIIYDGVGFRVLSGARSVTAPFSVTNPTSQALGNNTLAQVNFATAGGSTSFGTYSTATFTFTRAGTYYVSTSLGLGIVTSSASNTATTAQLRQNGTPVIGGSSSDGNYSPGAANSSAGQAAGAIINAAVGDTLAIYAASGATAGYVSSNVTTASLGITLIN